MDPSLALLTLTIWFILPVAHIALSPNAGAWTPPKGCGCPFGPRVGWLVIVLMLGLIGWLLFLRSRQRIKKRNLND